MISGRSIPAVYIGDAPGVPQFSLPVVLVVARIIFLRDLLTSAVKSALQLVECLMQKDVNSSDLLMIEPTEDFYIKEIRVDQGIQITLQGRIKDILEGAGTTDLVSVMPNAFEEMDNKKRVFTIIPAIAGTLLSIFGLKKKDQES